MVSSHATVNSGERGQALFLAMAMTIAMVGTTGTYLALTVTQSKREVESFELERAARVLDGAVGLKIAQLKRSISNVAPLTGTASNGVRYSVKALPVVGSFPPTFQVGGYAEDGRSTARALVVIQQELSDVAAGLPGAVTAYAPVDFNGNLFVDGRDWNLANSSIVGTGTYGVASRSTIELNGNASAAGNGNGWSSSETATNRLENAVWGNGTDADGDGVVEPMEKPYPTTVDQAVGLTEGVLKARAQTDGTYFANAAAWQSYIAANSSVLPGGKVFFLDFDANGMNVTFPTTMSAEPSIFVNHWRDPSVTDPTVPAGISDLGNIQGCFRGLMIIDGVRHLNGGFMVVGGIISLASQSYGNVFGNGGALIRYSTEVLTELPRFAQNGNPFKIVAWVESGTDLLGPPVSDCVTLVRAIAAQ